MKNNRFYSDNRCYMIVGIALAALLALPCACSPEKATEVPSLSSSPVPSEEPLLISFSVEATPIPTATPEPTPEPTPELTPAPTMDPESDAAKNLLMDMEQVRLIVNKRGTRVYEEPSADADIHGIRNAETDSNKSEFIILDEVTSENGKPFYYIAAAFNGERGYLPVEYADTSELATEGLTGYGILNRPRTPIYKTWYTTETSKKIKDHRTYCAVRVLGSWKQRAFVVTEDGVFGYVDKEQIYYISREEMEQYLIERQEGEKITGVYSAEAFLSAAEEQLGSEQESTEKWLVDLLSGQGLRFNPGYYFHFRKIFSEELYPDGFYLDEVYQSLLFKLRNTAGDMVTCEGEETQWDYIGDYAQVQPGDILFFATYGKGDTAIIPDVEVVFFGKHSGHVTKCGIVLGGNRMLTVEAGQVMCIEDITQTDYFKYFDCARRISPTVTDPVSHLSECQISAIYDRLGTPYDNFTRLGDRSYDCSGIVSWSFSAIDVTRKRNDKEGFAETTASGLTHLTALYYKGQKLPCGHINKLTRQPEDIDQLQRGDYVFLLDSKHTGVGHVMIYLGDNTVIHSTTINSKYQGTLVAQFRPALQKLYACTVRIAPVEQ